MLPEEQVRVWFLAQLHAAGVEQYRIATEYPVKIGGRTLRADIVIFERGTTNARAIVECKAPGVDINEGTLRQAAVYNTQLKARYIMATNGAKTYIYDCELSCYVDDLLAEL